MPSDEYDRIPSRAAAIVDRRLGEEVVFFNATSEQFYATNLIGGRVWDLIDGQRTVADIVDALQAEYGVDRARVQADVTALLAEFARHGLIAWRDGSPDAPPY